jgi:TonB-linked SusC/RagA family outer membrane protein
MRKRFLLFIVLLSFSVLYAQEKIITGRVENEKSEPLSGVNVLVKGAKNGTTTDATGSFKLNVPSGSATLQLSFVGYESQEVKITSSGIVNAKLVPVAVGLEEIVTVGYGSQKKVNVSGAIESVKGETLVKRNTMQTSLALQGVSAGVTVTSNNGKPGKEGTAIRIRGIGTLNDNNPLVLVDGVATSIDGVNPNDIETMSILKDAASAAIYGSRAANGVILITTKRGKSDKVRVSYNGSVGISTPVELPQNATAWDYMALYDEANGNDLRTDAGVPGGAVYGPAKIDAWKASADRDAFPNSDMIRETYKKQSTQTQHYIGFSHGNDHLKSNTSLTYQNQDAVIPNTYLKRYGLRSNNTYTVNKYVDFGLDLSIRSTTINDAAPGTEIEGMMRQPAIYPTRFSNGVWGNNYAGTPHTMQFIFDKLNMRNEQYQESIAKLYARIRPIEGMTLDFTYTPRVSTSSFKGVSKTTNLYDYKTGDVIYKSTGMPSMYETREITTENDLNALATYDKTLKKHHITTIGGFQFLTNYFNNLYGTRQGNSFQQFQEINSFNPTGQITNGYSTEWALMSYFGRVNYSYDGKYFLEGNVRYDGSSRFATGYKWGVFPSFSAAWRFTNEKFMKNVNWLSSGKLRASWGQLGNQSGLGSNYPFALSVNTSLYTVFGGILNPGYAAQNYALNNITWESTTMTNLGVDLAFLHNKLNVSFDWYDKQTNDILLNMAIPGVMGYSNSPKQNAGSVENKGWDLTLSYNNSVGKLNYRLTGVLSDVKNKITELGGLGPQVSGTHVKQVGSPIDAFYGLLADGLFSSFTEARAYPVAQFGKLQGGDVRYKDMDKDSKITGSDRVVLGNPIPRYTYSFDLFASWNGLDLSAFLQGVGKRDDYISGWLAYPFQNASTAFVQHLDRWYEAKPNANATYPRLSINQQSNNLQPSTFWMLNGAYLRLKNIQLGYTIPVNAIKKSGITGLRVYANGNNVFTKTKMPLGMDPESPENNNNSIPLIKTYTFGVEVKF